LCEACFAKESAFSFPGISWCPGTQFRSRLAHLPAIFSATLKIRIWQACPGVSKRDCSRKRAPRLSVNTRKRLSGLEFVLANSTAFVIPCKRITRMLYNSRCNYNLHSCPSINKLYSELGLALLRLAANTFIPLDYNPLVFRLANLRIA
jgi:hypothetical protein